MSLVYGIKSLKLLKRIRKRINNSIDMSRKPQRCSICYKVRSEHTGQEMYNCTTIRWLTPDSRGWTLKDKSNLK